MAAAYRSLTFERLKESVYLTARTSAMVCFLFNRLLDLLLGLAYLGGHEVIEHWVKVLERRRRCSSSSPSHHLPAGLAAGMDGDTHHLCADLPAVAKNLQYRSNPVRHPGLAQHQTSFNTAADGDGRVLPEGFTTACEADGDLRRVAAFVFLVFITMAMVYIFPEIALWLPDKLYGN